MALSVHWQLALHTLTVVQLEVDRASFPLDAGNVVSGSVAYDELGTDGVSRVVEVRILRFGAPLFFANIGILKVGWCASV